MNGFRPEGETVSRVGLIAGCNEYGEMTAYRDIVGGASRNYPNLVSRI